MSNNPQIGFSTGCLYHTHTTKQALATLCGKCNAVELCFVKYEPVQWGWLDVVTNDDLASFEHISFHAPKYAYGDDAISRTILGRIMEFHKNIHQLDTVVFHPDEIRDFQTLAQCDLPVAIENMDWRKTSYKNVEDLQPIFITYPSFKFVLDLNHVFTNDRTMKLADQLHAAFGDRLAHYHLSGFAELHDPLFQTRQIQIIASIHRGDAPIIVESDLMPEEIDSERQFILNSLRSPSRYTA